MRTLKVKIFGTLLVLLLALSLQTGCQTAETDTEQQTILEDKGILVGIVDSQAIEIEINGTGRVFALAENVNVNHIADGSAIVFTYVEEENRPLILTIEALESFPEVLTAKGTYNGQIDSHSVEIEINGEPIAFTIGENISLEGLSEGDKIEFTYIEELNRPQLLTIDYIESPEEESPDLLIGEGIYIGQIDAQSVELKLNRAFALAEDINIDNFEDGVLVAFTFVESGQRAIIESIKVVDQPIEGDVMHGTLIGRIDSQSVEIEYYQAFAIGNASLADISDGDYVVFTYHPEEHRPVLITIEQQ